VLYNSPVRLFHCESEQTVRCHLEVQSEPTPTGKPPLLDDPATPISPGWGSPDWASPTHARLRRVVRHTVIPPRGTERGSSAAAIFEVESGDPDGRGMCEWGRPIRTAPAVATGPSRSVRVASSAYDVAAAAAAAAAVVAAGIRNVLSGTCMAVQLRPEGSQEAADRIEWCQRRASCTHTRARRPHRNPT
jgi:hypothetical protein